MTTTRTIAPDGTEHAPSRTSPGTFPTGVSAAVMDNDRLDTRLPHILERLAPLDPVVVADRGDPWRTSREAWSSIAPDATHHLVVQNDVRLAPDLLDAIAVLMAAHPDAGFAFYAQWDTNCAFRVRMGALGGDAVVEASARDWVPAQGLLLPRSACETLAGLPPDADRDDDEVLARVLFYAVEPVRLGLSVPNLVEHDDDPRLGFNARDGLRRTASYAEHAGPWSDLPETTWDGHGWEEIGLGMSAEGAHLDFGLHAPAEPQALRQIRVPWRRVVAEVGLAPGDLHDLARTLVAEVGPAPAAGPDPEALHEYAVACALHGVAWRSWWRGGRPAGTWSRSALVDAALVSLWRSGARTDGLDPQDVLPLAHRALAAGARLDGAVAAPEAYARLTRWFRTTRAFDRIW
ncbi:hypothetical protein [Cellulomonas wangsupingiae]|uniref:hypothetical protein n=1 Tax=Cellulomonas wangsupingiae TaxID=2968085 RepID=UPI001D0E6AD7|nr:hypothetical protein [Cellulomonas wangsupingiae]MCM0640389.1 hypothetical protein [Cellulomonas wangsupingiae]